MTPYQKAGFNELSLFRVIGGTEFDHGSIVWLREDDGSTCPAFSDGHEYWHQIIPGFHDSDLKELPKDADGFYLWEGGKQPVPDDWEIAATGINFSFLLYASEIDWAQVSRFKPTSRPDMPRHSEAVDRAESLVITEDQGDILVDRTRVLDTLVQQAQEDGEYSALDVQEGGDHYKKLKIQPMEYSMANSLDACQHTIIKYVTRFRDKGGIEDLRKAKHCIDMLIEFEADE